MIQLPEISKCNRECESKSSRKRELGRVKPKPSDMHSSMKEVQAYASEIAALIMTRE